MMDGYDMIHLILIVVTALYIMASIAHILHGNYAMSLVFFAYALGNIGLYLAGNLH